MSDGMNLMRALTAAPVFESTEEVQQLRSRIEDLEATVVRLEWELFRVLAKDYSNESPPRHISIKTIAEMVENRTGMSLHEMRSGRRFRSISNARHLFWYLAKEFTRNSLPNLGRFLDKDHTSVIHGIKRVVSMMKSDENFRSLVYEISSDIRKISSSI